MTEAAVGVEKLSSLLTLTFALHWFACQLTRKEMKKNTNPRNSRRIDVLYDPENDPEDPRQATVDIVSVHSLDGLGSNIDRPWSWPSDQPEKSVHWLQDKNMLRSEIPTARIMTFNYDSTWKSNAPQLLLESLGEDLIRSLHDVRHDQQRPVVFVAHGFGGLVVQDGLLFSHSEREFEDIIHCTAGFVSLGTPFRGTKIYWNAELVASIMRLCGTDRSIPSLLSYDNTRLRDKTHTLTSLRKVFSFPLFCFYEVFETTFTKLPPMLNFFKAIVVDEASACIPGDEQAHLQVNHDELNKYSGPEDKSYQSVSSEIAKMCKNAATVIKSQNGSDKSSPIYWGRYVRT